jgi:thiamine-phosphate pyrophosphorylase
MQDNFNVNRESRINLHPLYLITDRTTSSLNLTEITQRAVSAGIKTIQLREKNMTKKELYKEALSIRKFTLKHRAAFIINDYVDIALAVNADGVHLGQEDMPIKEARKLLGENKIIGISTHSMKQAVDAQRAGADYIGFGPIFKTTTKDAGKPKGIKSLIEIKKHIKIPVVAIGGITIDNVSEVFKSGADAAAVASGILSGDIKRNIERFYQQIKAAKIK